MELCKLCLAPPREQTVQMRKVQYNHHGRMQLLQQDGRGGIITLSIPLTMVERTQQGQIVTGSLLGFVEVIVYAYNENVVEGLLGESKHPESFTTVLVPCCRGQAPEHD